MRNVSLLILGLVLVSVPGHAGGLLSRLFWKGDIERSGGPRPTVRLLELEVVQRPVRVIAGELARVQFRVKQLTNPDPQFVGPPVRLRRYTQAGAQIEATWIQPNGEGVYEAAVSMREASPQYLYFETGDERTMLAKVPWVVLRSGD